MTGPPAPDDPSPRPLLLVDVDGVLSAFGPLGGHEDGAGPVSLEAEFEARGFEICVPAGTRAWFATLEMLFACVWATSWEHHAPETLSPTLGFGAQWPVIRVWEHAADVGTMKLPAVQRFAELPEHRARPLAWIDDDLGPDALEWAARRTRDGTPTLMVRPDADVGLTARHVARLVSFSEEVRPRG